MQSRGGGGGTPLYKLYRYVPPQRVLFMSRFGLQTGIDFTHYGLKSGMVIRGTTRRTSRARTSKYDISNRRDSVSSHFQTLRRELKV